MIETKNLQLVICQREHIEAFLRSRDNLAALLGVTIPAGWPTFPEAFSLPPEPAPVSTGWDGYFFIHAADKVLVGNGGFKGAPDESGIVEIGYEIAPELQNRGFATEAARGMIDYAFAHPQVRAVIAHTLAETNASNNVLQKVGMKFAEELDDPGEGKIWRWQIRREAYHPT